MCHTAAIKPVMHHLTAPYFLQWVNRRSSQSHRKSTDWHTLFWFCKWSQNAATEWNALKRCWTRRTLVLVLVTIKQWMINTHTFVFIQYPWSHQAKNHQKNVSFSNVCLCSRHWTLFCCKSAVFLNHVEQSSERLSVNTQLFQCLNRL